MFTADLAGYGRTVGLIGAAAIAVPAAVLAYRRQRALDDSNILKANSDYDNRREGIERDRQTRYGTIAARLSIPR